MSLFQIRFTQLLQPFNMRCITGVAKLCLGHFLFLLHQFIVVIIIYKRHASSDARFTVYESPWKKSDGGAAIQKKVNVAADALGMDDAVRKQVEVHQLIFAVVKKFGNGLAMFLLENFFRLACLARLPITNNGVHRVIGTAAIHGEPTKFFALAPIGKFPIRSRMLHHVANLIGRWLIPTEVMIAGVDDQDVALFHFDSFFDHLAGVYVVVAAHVAKSTIAPS